MFLPHLFVGCSELLGFESMDMFRFLNTFHSVIGVEIGSAVNQYDKLCSIYEFSRAPLPTTASFSLSLPNLRHQPFDKSINHRIH